MSTTGAKWSYFGINDLALPKFIHYADSCALRRMRLHRAYVWTDKRILGKPADSGDRLGAEFAASGCDRNVAEALRTGLRGRRSCGGMKFLDEILRRQDEEEVDDSGDKEKVHDGSEKVSIADFASIDVTNEVAKVRFADDCP